MRGPRNRCACLVNFTSGTTSVSYHIHHEHLIGSGFVVFLVCLFGSGGGFSEGMAISAFDNGYFYLENGYFYLFLPIRTLIKGDQFNIFSLPPNPHLTLLIPQTEAQTPWEPWGPPLVTSLNKQTRASSGLLVTLGFV